MAGCVEFALVWERGVGGASGCVDLVGELLAALPGFVDMLGEAADGVVDLSEGSDDFVGVVPVSDGR